MNAAADWHDYNNWVVHRSANLNIGPPLSLSMGSYSRTWDRGRTESQVSSDRSEFKKSIFQRKHGMMWPEKTCSSDSTSKDGDAGWENGTLDTTRMHLTRGLDTRCQRKKRPLGQDTSRIYGWEGLIAVGLQPQCDNPYVDVWWNVVSLSRIIPFEHIVSRRSDASQIISIKRCWCFCLHVCDDGLFWCVCL